MSESLSPSERMHRAQMAAHTRWAQCDDRTAATEPARRAAQARWDREVDPDGVLSPQERARRAESAKKAHMARMAFNSAKARRLRRNADALDAEVASSEQSADDSGPAGAEDPQPGLEGGES